MRALGSKLLIAVFSSVVLSAVAIAQVPASKISESIATVAPALAAVESTVKTDAAVPATQKVPLQVTFEDGQLTIHAENSTLREVLDAVHTKTGATIDAPTLDAGSRVVATILGPGDPKKILTSLLYGTRYNFYLLTSLDTPDKIDRLILKDRIAGLEEAFATHNAAAAEIEHSAQETRTLASLNAAHGSSAEDAEGRKGERQPMPSLPNEINPALWNLYPQLAQSAGLGGATSNTITAASGASGGLQEQPASPYAGMKPQVDSNGQIVLPPGISPEILKLYPANLMQLIQNGGNGAAPPPAPVQSSGPPVFWDQVLR